MMRRVLIMTALLLVLLASPSRAFTVSGLTLPDDLDSFVPDEIKEAVGDADELFSADGLSKLDGSFFGEFIMKTLSLLLRPALQNFCLLTGVVIIGALVSLLRESLKPRAGGVIELMTTLVLATAAYGIISEQIGRVGELLGQMNLFMNGMTGVMGTLYAAGGNAAAAVASGGMMAILLSLMENISSLVLVPLLRICFALTLISAVNDAFNLSGFTAFVRNTFTGILAFVMSVLAAVLSFQSVIAQGADGAAVRMVKFAASSFIPVVGGTVAEAVRTISGSVSFLRGISGGAAIAVILMLTIPVLLSLFVNRAVFSFCAASAGLTGGAKEGEFLKETARLYDFAIAVTAAMAMMFIFSLTLFARTASAAGV